MRKSNIFFYLHVLYTEIFTLKAYNSAKKQQMTECESRDQVLEIYEEKTEV